MRSFSTDGRITFVQGFFFCFCLIALYPFFNLDEFFISQIISDSNFIIHTAWAVTITLFETAYGILVMGCLIQLKRITSKTDPIALKNLALLKAFALLTPFCAWSGVAMYVASGFIDDLKIVNELQTVGPGMVGFHILLVVYFNSRMRLVQFPRCDKKGGIQPPEQDTVLIQRSDLSVSHQATLLI